MISKYPFKFDQINYISILGQRVLKQFMMISSKEWTFYDCIMHIIHDYSLMALKDRGIYKTVIKSTHNTSYGCGGVSIYVDSETRKPGVQSQ